MSADDSIFTYIRAKRHYESWADFITKHGPAVRAPDWALSRAEKAALEPAKPVMQGKPKGGRAA